MVGRTTFDYAGEAAVVTGSTRGIGRGIAASLAEHDADVLVVSRSEADVEETAAALSSAGDGRVVGVAADVAEADDVERMVERAVDEFDGVDLLVNNAATWPEEGNMVDASLDDWDRTMAVNVRSQYYAAQLVARDMIGRGVAGNVVNVTSQTGDRRAGGRGLYGVSNTAVNGLTWRLAHDLAEYGIRVNAVSTDVTDSSQLRSEAGRIADDEGKTTEEVLAEWGEARPLGRLGTPGDIADAVLFLASDRADYVVGTILRVSGGGNLQ